MNRALEPRQVWDEAQRGELRILDLRTSAERRRYGAPPGAIPVSLARHVLNPAGADTVHLCQHAMRSKLTQRNGAAEGRRPLRRLARRRPPEQGSDLVLEDPFGEEGFGDAVAVLVALDEFVLGECFEGALDG